MTRMFQVPDLRYHQVHLLRQQLGRQQPVIHLLGILAGRGGRPQTGGRRRSPDEAKSPTGRSAAPAGPAAEVEGAVNQPDRDVFARVGCVQGGEHHLQLGQVMFVRVTEWKNCKDKRNTSLYRRKRYQRDQNRIENRFPFCYGTTFRGGIYEVSAKKAEFTPGGEEPGRKPWSVGTAGGIRRPRNPACRTGRSITMAYILLSISQLSLLLMTCAYQLGYTL